MTGVGGGAAGAVVAVTGDVDVATELAWRQACLAAMAAVPGKPVVLDLAGAGCFGSTGVNLLVWLSAKAALTGRLVAVINAPPLARQVMDICQVRDLPALTVIH